MTKHIFNEKQILARKLISANNEWVLQGTDDKNFIINIYLKDIHVVDGIKIDEIVIIRPLTNKIVVDHGTNNVLKIYTDTKDDVIDISVQIRQ